MVVSKDTPVKKTIRKTIRKEGSDMNNSMSCDQGSCCSSTHKIRGMVVILLLIANLIVPFFKDDSLSLEILKMGGKENYEKIQTMMQTDAYKEYTTQGIDAMIMQQMQQQNQQTPAMGNIDETGMSSEINNSLLNEAETKGE